MPEPLLTVTVVGQTMDELRRARDGATHADLVEVRLDRVSRPDAAGALEGRHRPVIVTCRAKWEGGGFEGSEEERHRILADAVAAGAEFVDVEARAEFVPAIVRARRGRGIVLSLHTSGTPPRDLGERARAMRSAGAEVVKIAVEAERLSDMLPLMEIARDPQVRTAEGSSGHVLIAMGQPGVPSRVLAAVLGNRWTYAGAEIAPGQMPASRLLAEFRFRRIRPDAAIYGVVGNPIAHSLSPVMHNAGFAALGLNAAYVPLQASDVDDFVAFAQGINLRGASITSPFKVDMLSKVVDVDAVGRRVGAINTLLVRDGRWVGANTDVEGFLTPLVGRMRLRGARVTVLGAGGAARAVAVALAQHEAAVTVCARRRERAADVAALAQGVPGSWPPRPGSWDVLVNTTSCAEDPMAGVALDGEIVFDLVYAPAETPLLARARAEGCLTIGGIEMLIAQAERQFELWTGQPPPAGLFRAACGMAAGDQPATSSKPG